MKSVPEKTTLNAPTKGQATKIAQSIRAVLKPEDIEKVLADLGIDKDATQRVIGSMSELQSDITDVLATSLKRLSVNNQFVVEEVESNFGYLSGYKPKEIVEQVHKLSELFPGIGYVNKDLLAQIEKGEVVLPTGAEGWFAIPHWSKIGSSYQEALEKVLALLENTFYDGYFENYRQGQLGECWLHETSDKEGEMKTLQQSQNADILLVPAQFGLRHRGRSADRACAVMNTGEFSLGAYEIVIMLLTHPERLQKLNDLWIDCAGDRYSLGIFFCSVVLNFWCDHQGLHFDCRPCDDPDSNFGSVSGFMPSLK